MDERSFWWLLSSWTAFAALPPAFPSTLPFSSCCDSFRDLRECFVACRKLLYSFSTVLGTKLNSFRLTGTMGIVFPYLGEFQSTKYREKLLCWMELFWTVGIIALPGTPVWLNVTIFKNRQFWVFLVENFLSWNNIGTWFLQCDLFSLAQGYHPHPLLLMSTVIAWLVIPLDINYETEYFVFRSWNLFVALCSLPSIFLGVWLCIFPESPKYLIEGEMFDEALNVFREMYSLNTGNPPDEYPVSGSFMFQISKRC